MPLFVGMLLTALTAFTACLVLGPFTISLLRRLKFRQSIRDDGPSSHLKKAGTPTMGGILIIVALLAGLLVARPKSPEVIWVLFITLSFGLIGGIDDLIIIFTKNNTPNYSWGFCGTWAFKKPFSNHPIYPLHKAGIGFQRRFTRAVSLFYLCGLGYCREFQCS
jgi:UDP-N-acetylmuramyl pentapeptide phosphotransferase/UDP-N-acetylglucosamine-1-phosphate transferase